MIESSEKLAEYAGELFLLAFAGRDPEPAISMIRDYGLSGLYLSNENIPSREAAIKFTTTVQEASKKSGQSHSLCCLEWTRRGHGLSWQRIPAQALGILHLAHRMTLS